MENTLKLVRERLHEALERYASNGRILTHLALLAVDDVVAAAIADGELCFTDGADQIGA